MMSLVCYYYFVAHQMQRIPNQILLVVRNDGQTIICCFVVQPIEDIFRKQTRFPATVHTSHRCTYNKFQLSISEEIIQCARNVEIAPHTSCKTL